MIHPLRLETIKDVDSGRIAVAFDMALKSILQDCADRPAEKAKRKVTLTVTVEPIAAESGGAVFGVALAGTHVGFHVDTRMPKKVSRQYHMVPDRKGTIVFNDMSPEDANQRTTDELQSTKGED